MPLALQEKMNWLEQVSSALVAFINKEHEKQGTPKEGDREVALLGEELVQGFHWITKDLMKIHPTAASDIHHWAVQNEGSFDALFKYDPKTLERTPWVPLAQIQQFIPQKYIHYLFYTAQDLYREKEMLKADRVFRLLTLLYPQNADFWIWLGLCQQQRQLPELALISFTIATVLDRQNPYTYFYKAQCWVELKGWEQAKISFKECLDEIGTDLTFHQVKIKCEEFLEAISKTSDVRKNRMPPIGMFQEMAFQPHEAINNLFLNKSEVPPFTPLVPDEWKMLFDELEKKTALLADQLNSMKESFNHEINTFDFFEQNSIIMTQESVKIPLKTFSQISTLSLCFFFGGLLTGMAISAQNKRFKEEIVTNQPLKIAYSVSSILDQSEPSLKKGINKYVYIYDKPADMAFNQIMTNPEYGSSTAPYQENEREDNRIRVSLFYPEDIVGKSILDFGCNEGGILFACRNLGATTITGVDINPWCIGKANDWVSTQKIKDAQFYVGDMENRAFLSTLPQRDTVLLLSILDTSIFVKKTAVISNVSRFAKHALYYEGHVTPESHVPRMYEFLVATDFTRFEYLGRFARRILIRCSRDLIEKDQIPPNAITSDDPDSRLLSATEIYLFTDSPRNPPFSKNCNLIQFVKR